MSKIINQRNASRTLRIRSMKLATRITHSTFRNARIATNTNVNVDLHCNKQEQFHYETPFRIGREY